MAKRKWTEEQRKQQSLKIRYWQPWQYSTGAKTIEGKAKVSQNAFKGSLYLTLKNLAKCLKKQKQFINEI